MPRLKTCPACSRHVFVHETRCPFCDGDCSQQARAPIFAIKAGMSRAQRFAVVAAMAGQTAAIGCNAVDDPAPDPVPEIAIPVYGAPIPPGPLPGKGVSGGGGAPAGSGGRAGSAGSGMTMPQPLYGGVFFDAGTAGAGGDPGDEDAGE
jgi:hypothetical protein